MKKLNVLMMFILLALGVYAHAQTVPGEASACVPADSCECITQGVGSGASGGSGSGSGGAGAVGH